MRGVIRRHSKGTWQPRYDAPPNGTGKRRFHSETVKGSKREAERVLRERLAAIGNGGYVPRDKETVADFMERWLETHAASSTGLQTQHGYQRNVARYIRPAIGNVPLQELMARHIKGMYAAMLDQSLSNTTVIQLHRILKQTLSHAVKWVVLTRNVADATTPPRLQRIHIEIWDTETIDLYLDAAECSHIAQVGRRNGQLAYYLPQ